MLALIYISFYLVFNLLGLRWCLHVSVETLCYLLDRWFRCEGWGSWWNEHWGHRQHIDGSIFLAVFFIKIFFQTILRISYHMKFKITVVQFSPIPAHPQPSSLGIYITNCAKFRCKLRGGLIFLWFQISLDDMKWFSICLNPLHVLIRFYYFFIRVL